MGTGIVALALRLDGQIALSAIGLVLTAAGWVTLAIATTERAVRDRGALRDELAGPTGLADVAATAVLGSLLLSSGGRVEGTVLLPIAAAIELLVLPGALRNRPPWDGRAFMWTVSVQSLAGLAALAGLSWRVHWLVYTSLALWVFGLLLYPLALANFDLRELRAGHGAHWVAGGALAISALALAEAGRAAAALGDLHTLVSILKPLSVIVWVAAVLWLLALGAFELAAPRLSYHLERWSTVFPVGMYAAASFEVARLTHAGAIHSFASVWTWVAVAVWAAAAVGLLRWAWRRAPSAR